MGFMSGKGGSKGYGKGGHNSGQPGPSAIFKDKTTHTKSGKKEGWKGTGMSGVD